MDSEHTSSSLQAIYSGGDDSALRCSLFSSLEILDEQTGNEVALSSPGGLKGLGANSEFSGGVTSILPMPFPTQPGQELLLVGSYDESVRVYAIYDHRSHAPDTKSKAIATHEVPSGGIWRLKFLRDYNVSVNDPNWRTNVYSFKILASCMHAGARIIRATGSFLGDWKFETLAEMTEHKSMNYGSDVRPGTKLPLDDTRAEVVSTSFYDRRLNVWIYQQEVVRDSTQS
jgi:diphthamide biosynthesis protein 7